MNHSNLLFTIATFVCFTNCSFNNERLTLSSLNDSLDPYTLLTKAGIKSLDDLCYHEGTELVLQPSRFDYTRSGNEPTHRAIKVFPKSISEQQLISNLEGIRLSYIPFGYIPASPEIQTMAKGLGVAAFSETSPYTQSVTDFETGPTEIQLPIMYVLWPLEKPLPEGIEYEECFQIFVPTVTESVDAQTKSEIVQDSYPALFRSYDAFLDTYIPLNKLAVHITNGYIIGTQYTNTNGRVYIDPYLIGIDPTEFPSFSVYYTMNTPKWTITRDGSLPIHVTLGYVYSLWPNSFNSGTRTFNLVSASTEYEIHRALDYYHYASNPYFFSIALNETPILVQAVLNGSTSDSGSTALQTKVMTIYNNGNNCNNVISTVLHELGHLRHFYNHYNGYLPDYLLVNELLRESYASFIGWYLGEQYYISKGYVQPITYPYVNDNWCQLWQGTEATPYYWYSPLFVDLVDDFNQSDISSIYLNDDINEFDILDVEELISSCKTVSECKNHPICSIAANKLNAYFSYYGI